MGLEVDLLIQDLLKLKSEMTILMETYSSRMKFAEDKIEILEREVLCLKSEARM
jgi:hypothetical protein